VVEDTQRRNAMHIFIDIIRNACIMVIKMNEKPKRQHGNFSPRKSKDVESQQSEYQKQLLPILEPYQLKKKRKYRCNGKKQKGNDYTKDFLG